MIDFKNFNFLKIESDTVIKTFDCGDDDLNEFLFDDSKNYLDSMLAVTYLMEDKTANKTVAYYCLLNDKITLDPDEKSKWNKLNRQIPNNKRYHAYPAVKIGRFAVSKDYAHQHIGENLILLIKMIFSRLYPRHLKYLRPTDPAKRP